MPPFAPVRIGKRQLPLERWGTALLALIATGCVTASALPADRGGPGIQGTQAVTLPGGDGGAVSLDYLAMDRTSNRVWVPAGGTGSVDAIEGRTGALTRIEGFPTAEMERNGQRHVMGPSSASVGEGVVYVGNRATSEVCSIDAVHLNSGACLRLDSSPDGLQYVAATHELWATTPKDSAIVVLDSSSGALLQKGKVTLAGKPEGYSVDTDQGLFFTNLEDRDQTVVIDVHRREVVATWDTGCGKEGPRGLAFEPRRSWLLVACTNGVRVLDTKRGGALVAQASTGGGVDNVDYVPERRELFVASGQTGSLTIFGVGEAGLSVKATIPTAEGARVVVAGTDGTAYVADPQHGRVLIVRR